jgi:ligand-binding sensor domain-containing protein
MHVRTLSALLLVLGLVVAPAASALDATRPMNEYLIDFWQEESGLPQKHVFVMYQTRDGYLWIGTRGGLARFDGVRFTVYDDRQANQIEESEVQDLSEGPDGSLWIATYGGGLTRLHEGRFTTVRAKHGLTSDFVTAVAAAADGSVWVGTNRGVTHMKNGTFTAYDKKRGLPDEDIKSLFVDEQGVTWIGSVTALVSVKDGHVTSFRNALPGPRTYIKEIIGDGEGGLWLGTGIGLLRFNDGVAKTVVDTPTTVRGVARDPQGTIWFATDDVIYRLRDGAVESLSTSVTKVGADRMGRSFPISTIYTLLADREGSIWLGMTKYGVARLRDTVFTNIVPESANGRDVEVMSVLADSRGAVWLSASPRTVWRFVNGVLERLNVSVAGNVDTFFEDRAGTVWAMDGATPYRYEKGQLVKTSIGTLYGVVASVVAPDGTIWLADREKGLHRYRDGVLTHYAKADGLPGEAMRGLAVERDGTVWVGTKSSGLVRLHEGKFTIYTEKDGLPSDSIATIHLDRDNVAWVATRRGLVRIRNGAITTFNARHGLPANFFYEIIEDDLGYLWLTHGRGIVRLSREELNDVADGKASTVSSRSFGTESGMKSTAMVLPRQPAACKTKDGRLWFATGNGVTIVDPRSLVQNHLPPPVWIEEFRAGETSYPIGTAAVVPPGPGDLQIQYTGLSFVAPQAVRFKYKLDGFDTDWIDAGTRRAAYYTKLPPGSYVFRVKASNNDGVWNETGHAFAFRLRPHWYQTRVFHVSALLLVGLGLLGLHRSRLRGHERRARELAERVEEAVGQLKLLRGMLPICASCKKIRDDKGAWSEVETYIMDHTQADFSHGICPECIGTLYPDYAAANKKQTDA